MVGGSKSRTASLPKSLPRHFLRPSLKSNPLDRLEVIDPQYVAMEAETTWVVASVVLIVSVLSVHLQL